MKQGAASQKVTLNSYGLLKLTRGWYVRSELLVLLVMAPFLAYLSLANLENYPTISGWDEGMYLQFARNLAYHGEYATLNGDKFERLNPVGGSGPTLIAPVAVALTLSGDSLVAARLIIVIYLLITLMSLYLLLRYMNGWITAAISIPLFLVAGYATYDTLWLGRQVLAEIPMMAFVLLGVWTWFKSWRGQWYYLAASGLLFALAVVTKNQFIWVLFPTFVLLGLLNRAYYRELHWVYNLIPLLGVILGYGIWLLVSLWIVGPAGRADYLADQQALATASFGHISPQRWLTSLKLFYGSGQWPLTLAALAYCLYKAYRRTLVSYQYLTLALFSTVAMASFIGLSLPWARYLYPALALAALCGSLLIGDFIVWAGRRWQLGRLQLIVIAGLIVSIFAGPRLVGNVQRISTLNDSSAKKFALLLDQQAPAGTRILNWEWEIEFYSRHTFVHPPHRLFSALVDQVYNQYEAPLLAEPRIDSGIEYLVIGPFASQVQVFSAELSERPHYLLATEGPYQLYRFH